MIGIVVVSHSRALGEAVVALAREMAGSGDAPPLTVAAGLDGTTFGTDAAAVAAAIDQIASSADGVLVLLDIGSSLLSAEMACELIGPELAAKVRISPAPLVEGILPAVVAAAGGGGLDDVAREAEQGLAAKRAHLGEGGDLDTPARSSRAARPSPGVAARPSPGVAARPSPGVAARPSPGSAARPSRGSAARSSRGVAARSSRGVAARPSRGVAARPAQAAHPSYVDVTIADPHGLHARPAAKLVALVRSFDAEVTVANLDADGRPVPANSLSKVATLNAGPGTRLRLMAHGPEADEVLAAARGLVARDFAEEPSPEVDAAQATSPSTASHGSGLEAALGPAHVLRVGVDLDAYQAGSVSEEKERSDRAIAVVTGVIRRQQGSGGETGDILAAHLALLDDPALHTDVVDELDRGASAPAAWQAVLDRLAERFDALTDAYQRTRAQDIRAIERQLLQALVDPDSMRSQRDSVPAGSILVVDELDPSTAAALDAGAVGGVVTVRGGDTGHGAIVARSRGIPIFTGGGAAAAGIRNGQTIGFDSTTRMLEIDPDDDELVRLRTLLERSRRELRAATRRAKEQATTLDGVHIPVRANVSTMHDATAAAAIGADGSGLVRTETVFGGSADHPSSGEQAANFLSIAGALHPLPVTIRTWDVGGDKPVSFLPATRETNPMLGRRGLRLMRQHGEIFDEQLRGVCAAAEHAAVRVMFPMVTTREEVDWALQRLARAREAVGVGHVPVGIMVEVPAAALRVAQLAKGLDFVSIGTNDLTQYTLATDRGNANVAAIADALDPAVLQLIRHVVDHVPDGVEVGVCGDLASRPEAVPLLLGLGVRELSVAGPVVPRIKQVVRHTSMVAARGLARKALEAPSASAVRDLLAKARR